MRGGSPFRKDKDRAEIVHIGSCRPGDDQIAQGGKKFVAVIIGETGLRIDPSRRRAGQAVWVKQGPGIVLGPIDSIRVGGERMDTRLAVERNGEGEEKFRITPASP